MASSRRVGLADAPVYDAAAWTAYLHNGNAAPNAVLVSPNGDVLVFDDQGQLNYTKPHATSGQAADVEQDPNSPFYGWTEAEKAAYVLAQTGNPSGVSLALTASPDGKTASVDASKVAALQQIAATSSKVQGALAQSAAGNPPTAAQQAQVAAASRAQYVKDALAAYRSVYGAGGVYGSELDYLNAYLRQAGQAPLGASEMDALGPLSAGASTASSTDAGPAPVSTPAPVAPTVPTIPGPAPTPVLLPAGGSLTSTLTPQDPNIDMAPAAPPAVAPFDWTPWFVGALVVGGALAMRKRS